MQLEPSILARESRHQALPLDAQPALMSWVAWLYHIARPALTGAVTRRVKALARWTGTG